VSSTKQPIFRIGQQRVLVLAKRLPELIRFASDDRRLRKIYAKYKGSTMITADDYVENLRLARWIRHIPGSIIECGTWRGGMIAGMADVLGSDRRYYLFDSFQGLPPAKEIDGVAALAWQSNKTSPGYYNNCTASEEDARAAMSASPAKDYHIIKGWFDETLQKMKLSEPIALLRMDADWYESTKSIVDAFALHVASGGMIIVDDYYTWEGCTRAVNEVAALRNWKIRQSRGGICFIII
jgi:O-methyltransferase